MTEISISTTEPRDPRPRSLAGELLALLSKSADAFPPKVREADAAAAFVAIMMARAVIVECRSEGRLAGAIAFYANDAETRRGFITFVAVDPEFRDHGIGRHLIVEAMAYLRRVSFASVSLKVRVGNSAAIHIYRSAGFEAIGETAEEIEMSRLIEEREYAPQPFDPFAMAKGALGPCL